MYNSLKSDYLLDIHGYSQESKVTSLFKHSQWNINSTKVINLTTNC